MEPLIKMISAILGSTLARYFVLAGLGYFIVYKVWPRRFRKNKIQKRQASLKDLRREIGHSLLSGVVLSAEACLVLLTPLRSHTLVYRQLNDYPYWWIPISLVLCLVIHDTYFYWMHRMLHHKRIFRYTHLVHHLSTNPSPWAAYSFHFLEAIAEGGIVILLAFLLPMHPLTLVLFSTTSLAINVYGHLGYEIMPRGLRHSFLFGIINTSVHHNLHHSHFKGNYGLYFRHWDRWMGTENPDYVMEYDQIQDQRFGAKAADRKNSQIINNTTEPIPPVTSASSPLAAAGVESR